MMPAAASPERWIIDVDAPFKRCVRLVLALIDPDRNSRIDDLFALDKYGIVGTRLSLGIAQRPDANHPRCSLNDIDAAWIGDFQQSHSRIPCAQNTAEPVRNDEAIVCRFGSGRIVRYPIGD